MRAVAPDFQIISMPERSARLERATLTVGEASALLGISSDAVYQAIRRHEIPAIRIGRRVVLSRAALDRILNDGRLTDK